MFCQGRRAGNQEATIIEIGGTRERNLIVGRKDEVGCGFDVIEIFCEKNSAETLGDRFDVSGGVGEVYFVGLVVVLLCKMQNGWTVGEERQ